MTSSKTTSEIRIPVRLESNYGVYREKEIPLCVYSLWEAHPGRVVYRVTSVQAGISPMPPQEITLRYEDRHNRGRCWHVEARDRTTTVTSSIPLGQPVRILAMYYHEVYDEDQE